MTEIVEENTKLQDGGHHILDCSNCRKKLADIWVVRPNLDMTFKYLANCPYCGDKSFAKEIKGGIHYAGIAELNPNSETDDDWKTYTVVEDIDWGDGVIKLNVKKAKMDKNYRVGYNKDVEKADPDSIECVCKLIYDEGSDDFNYFVKVNHLGHFYHPQNDNNLYILTFKRVDKVKYDLYIRFLKTKNDAWYHQSQRD